MVLHFAAEQFVESVKLEIPGCGAAVEPGLRAAESGGARANEMDAATAAAFDEAGALEHTEMAGDRGERDAEGAGEAERRARMPRRVGSARAEKTALMCLGWLTTELNNRRRWRRNARDI
jgi:hypothetical protein